jgi:hypothetical protein
MTREPSVISATTNANDFVYHGVDEKICGHCSPRKHSVARWRAALAASLLAGEAWKLEIDQ